MKVPAPPLLFSAIITALVRFVHVMQPAQLPNGFSMLDYCTYLILSPGRAIAYSLQSRVAFMQIFASNPALKAGYSSEDPTGWPTKQSAANNIKSASAG
jgi:hypothetical protein